MVGRAIVLPEFNLVGQTIHYDLPDFLKKLSIYFKYHMFTNVFEFYRVDHRKITLN